MSQGIARSMTARGVETGQSQRYGTLEALKAISGESDEMEAKPERATGSLRGASLRLESGSSQASGQRFPIGSEAEAAALLGKYYKKGFGVGASQIPPEDPNMPKPESNSLGAFARDIKEYIAGRSTISDHSRALVRATARQLKDNDRIKKYVNEETVEEAANKVEELAAKESEKVLAHAVNTAFNWADKGALRTTLRHLRWRIDSSKANAITKEEYEGIAFLLKCFHLNRFKSFMKYGTTAAVARLGVFATFCTLLAAALCSLAWVPVVVTLAATVVGVLLTGLYYYLESGYFVYKKSKEILETMRAIRSTDPSLVEDQVDGVSIGEKNELKDTSDSKADPDSDPDSVFEAFAESASKISAESTKAPASSESQPSDQSALDSSVGCAVPSGDQGGAAKGTAEKSGESGARAESAAVQGAKGSEKVVGLSESGTKVTINDEIKGRESLEIEIRRRTGDVRQLITRITTGENGQFSISEYRA